MHTSSKSSRASSPHLSRSPTPQTPLEDLFGSVPTSQEYVLVTGGLGFIGSHTVLELLKSGCNVIIIDNASNSAPDVFSRILKSADLHCAATGQRCPKAEWHEMDYRDEPRMRALFDAHAVSALQPRQTNIVGVIHFAAYKAVEESIRQPIKYYQNNIVGLVDFITLLDEYSIKNFIFSSSAAVYGNLPDGRQYLKEEHVVHEAEAYTDIDGAARHSEAGYSGITSPYGRTKFFGEAILFDIAQSDPSWNIVALRYFNPIGCDPMGLLGEDPAGIPSNLLPVVVRVMKGETPELSIYGSDWDTHDGTAVRDFIHVCDLARGHIAALTAIQAGKINGGFRTFNLGVGKGYSVLDVVSTMEAVSQLPIRRQFVDRRAGDVQLSVAAVDRAKVELGWHTRYTLVDACQDTLNFLRMREL
ncbi:udp-glucose 4-epimerase [Amniculicola lignicola CBS 123094]|uniref:Udp-glucose 4-epimerase n=1 Tax=Amniculicola lignicola CBS 123094 TaxID=1392246 RepID=A0A6A5WQ42_9PLEO|nr:udp-glucose 4-epimerase [Amniculicola lignicola CBS 123094]